jgi:hypothetical protein
MKNTNIILTLFLFCISVFFMQCDKEDLILTDGQDQALLGDENGQSLKKGPPSGGESAVNNLSFPALTADGYSITPISVSKFDVPYTGEYPGLTAEQIAILDPDGDPLTNPWYAQKTAGNVWQADFHALGSEAINWIDWGDAIEATDPKIRRPYRLELSIYVAGLSEPMTGYVMAELEYPSSSNELQGTNTNTYESVIASVASPKGKLVVQRFDDPSALTWNASLGQWDGAETPETISFAVELNVGGKLIFGASTGGWKPTLAGDYRITFFLESGSIVDLRSASIGNYDGVNKTFIEVVQAENNQPYVDATNNLTYVDVQVTTGGGGGGGKK